MLNDIVPHDAWIEARTALLNWLFAKKMGGDLLSDVVKVDFRDAEIGSQVEFPDNWLRYGNPWEVPRPDVAPDHVRVRAEEARHLTR